jgi:hypothetical protein
MTNKIVCIVYINIRAGNAHFWVLKSVTLSSPHYLTLNVPYAHLLPEFRPRLHVSLPLDDDSKFLACRVMSEKLTTLDSGEFSPSMQCIFKHPVYHAGRQI